MSNSNLPSTNTTVTELLAAYFSQRSAFLAQVIMADLVSSPFLPTQYQGNAGMPPVANTLQVPMMPNNVGYANGTNGHNANGHNANGHNANGHNANGHNANGHSTNGHSTNGHVATPLVANDVSTAAPQNEVVNEAVKQDMVASSGTAEAMTPTVVASSDTAEAEVAPSVLKMLVELVVEQTGFPADTISADAQLLDDLNLDSIKSAEVVAQVAKQLGVQGEVDPSAFANASLGEVAAALEELAGVGTKTVSSTPSQSALSSAAPSVAPSAVPSTTSTATAPVRSVPQPDDEITSWVRNFVVEYRVEESDSISAQEEEWQNTHLFPVDNWATAKVVIVAEGIETTEVEALKVSLQRKGAATETCTFEEFETRSLIQSPEFTHYIAVMPQIAEEGLSASDRLQKSMDQMYSIAAPMQASKALREYTSVTYLQFGGGYFGKLQTLNHIDQGCLIGFASTVHLERPDLKVRVIDIDPSSVSMDVMDRVLDDMARPDGYLSVGYDAAMTRRIPRPVIQDRTQYQKRDITWSADDVILVTGGAKGITAECALAFAQITGVKMALVGRSAHPQDNPTGKSSPEIAQTLRRYQQADLICNYYSCDVADAEALAALINQIETELGQVTGVIHGAAINQARRADNCPVSLARPEISPKVMGMFNLCDILADHPPKIFVGISSIAAVIGLPGNSWYSFSNEVLDQLLRRFVQQHPETDVFSVAYSVWNEVGMGARMGTVKNLGRMGIKAIPMKEGVDRFVQLMFNNPGDTQVGITSSLGGIHTLGRGFDTWRLKRVPPAPEYRFIEHMEIMDPGIEMIARTHLTLEKDSYVLDHVYNGTYLFPTVFGLEAMAQMVAYITGQSKFETARIEDIRLERPIVVDPKNGVTIEIRAEMPERDSATVPQTVLVEIRTEQTGFAKAHFAATFVLCEPEAAPNQVIERPSQPLGLNPHAHLYGGLLWQGNRFHRLQRIDSLDAQHMIFATQRGVAAIAPDQPFDRADGPFILGDPYCRDSLLQSVQPMVPQDIGLPIGIKSIQLYKTDATTNESCMGMATGQDRQGKNYNTSVVMTNENGAVIEHLEGYQIRMIDHRPDNPSVDDLVAIAVQTLVHEVENEMVKVTPTQPSAADQKQAEPAPACHVDELQLLQELHSRAKALNVTLPKASLAHVDGLHQLSAEERHQQELPIFSKTVGEYLNQS